MEIYPLKFIPQYKQRIWGGNKLSSELKKDECKPGCGESWELSSVEGSVSVVKNGFLEGNDLEELIEVYMGDLVGEKVYERFGNSFPLLIKFIDANDVLSVQVHPDDDTALERHNSYGKTEMWYVLGADPESWLISGFKKDSSAEEFKQHLENKSLSEILNYEMVKAGDVFYLPAGRIHAIGKGILIAEIQQTSDITYRVYDWDRVEANGQPRELHIENALDVINYKKEENYRTNYSIVKNQSVPVIESDYFKTNILEFDKSIQKDYSQIDSFVLFICTDGEFIVKWDEGEERVTKGEVILKPAALEFIELIPLGSAKFLEVYIE